MFPWSIELHVWITNPPLDVFSMGAMFMFKFPYFQGALDFYGLQNARVQPTWGHFV
jgi:hypothetical protein